MSESHDELLQKLQQALASDASLAQRVKATLGVDVKGTVSKEVIAHNVRARYVGCEKSTGTKGYWKLAFDVLNDDDSVRERVLWQPSKLPEGFSTERVNTLYNVSYGTVSKQGQLTFVDVVKGVATSRQYKCRNAFTLHGKWSAKKA